MTIRRLLLLLALPLATVRAEEDWSYLFADATHEDFYFDFLEEADPVEVFELGEDRGLRIKGKDHPEGYLQTLDEYSNYELEFEWRWPGEPGESGVLLHSSIDPAFSVWPESIEVQLKPGNVGDFWLLNQKIEVEETQMPKKSSERNRRLKLEDAEKPAGQWNHMRIVAEGDTIEVYLNKKLVNKGEKASTSSGMITFQAQESDIVLREVRLRELAD